MQLSIVIRAVKRYWNKYKAYVREATSGSERIVPESIMYWKEKLFTNFVTYLLPCCLMAVIPGVWISITEKVYAIAVIDLLAAASIPFVALNQRLKLVFRKTFIFFIIYTLSLVLMVYMGLFGPGLIYLLSLSVIAALLLPWKMAYWSIGMNLLVCIMAISLRQIDFLHPNSTGNYNFGVWLAVISNLVFLSLVVIALVNQAIFLFETAISNKKNLKHKLVLERAEGLRRGVRIKESEEQYRSLFLASPLPMWVLDPVTLRFLQVNEAAVNEYGFSYEEFGLLHISAIKIDDDMATLEQDLQTSLLSGKPLKIQTRHLRKNGEIFHVEVRFNITAFEGREASLVILRDITREVDYLHAIERQNKQLQQIAWTQSHAIRKPLANIISITDLVTADCSTIADKKLLDFLAQSAAELDACIRSISENTRP